MATFSERLKSLRSEKGWSQQRLADELNLSKSSVNMYERGEREPGFETMEAIADTGARCVFHDPLNLRNVDPTRLERMGIGQSSVARRRIGEIGRELGLDVSDSFENRLPDIPPSM